MELAARAFGAVALSPVSFLMRAKAAYGDRIAVIDGPDVLTYAQLSRRCERQAGALVSLGVFPGDRVSVLAPNTALALESHFGVPMSGGVLNALNARLSVGELVNIVDHAGSRVMLVDHEFAEVGRAVIAQQDRDVRLVVCGGPEDDYEDLLAGVAPAGFEVTDEWSLISLNYTSGTTGQPKGVMYAHRGAYLQSLAMAAQSGIGPSSVFLWTLPMFHCNGWCFPWAVTAVGGCHVMLRKIDTTEIWRLLDEFGITHFNAAPTVLNSIVNHPNARQRTAPLRVATGGAPPSMTLIQRATELNIDITHLYGLTETYGPAVICDWWPQWDRLDETVRTSLRARQGVANLVGMPVRVVDRDGHDVPADGLSTGEVVLRGNNVMLGYYRDREATRHATVDGPGGPWFRTGDIGVMHPDGYLELKDRAKDIIVSGGENIASVEVENVLDSHPAVLESAVVGTPDEYWGEIPVAFVTARPGVRVTEAELIDHVRTNIAHFKAPKRVVFGDLPKTGTGKVQKGVLRSSLRDSGT